MLIRNQRAFVLFVLLQAKILTIVSFIYFFLYYYKKATYVHRAHFRLLFSVFVIISSRSERLSIWAKVRLTGVFYCWFSIKVPNIVCCRNMLAARYTLKISKFLYTKQRLIQGIFRESSGIFVNLREFEFPKLCPDTKCKQCVQIVWKNNVT